MVVLAKCFMDAFGVDGLWMPVMDAERWSAGQCLSGTGWWVFGDPLIRGFSSK
jgi:hypothetical protein